MYRPSFRRFMWTASWFINPFMWPLIAIYAVWIVWANLWIGLFYIIAYIIIGIGKVLDGLFIEMPRGIHRRRVARKAVRMRAYVDGR